jgi:hypothetical protein
VPHPTTHTAMSMVIVDLMVFMFMQVNVFGVFDLSEETLH